MEIVELPVCRMDQDQDCGHQRDDACFGDVAGLRGFGTGAEERW